MRRLAVLMAVAATGFVPASASAQVFEIGHIPKCTQAIPAVVALSKSTTVVDVRVLLDGVGLSRAQQIVARANAAYSPESITLRATYESVALSGTDTGGLINQAKSRFGGSRPSGVDLVYVLTGKDISAAGQTSVAGQADCIGGVAFGDRAFAVGEDVDLFVDEANFLGLRFFADLAAKTFAHEVGHLLGAHHHYANCVEAPVPAVLEARGEPCTLMFNDLSFQRLQLGTVEALAVRGHAQRYAR